MEEAVRSFIIDTRDAYDRHGVIKYMTRSGGYVMARRPRAMPFVLSEKDWRKLPKNSDDGKVVDVLGKYSTPARPESER